MNFYSTSHIESIFSVSVKSKVSWNFKMWFNRFSHFSITFILFSSFLFWIERTEHFHCDVMWVWAIIISTDSFSFLFFHVNKFKLELKFLKLRSTQSLQFIHPFKQSNALPWFALLWFALNHFDSFIEELRCSCCYCCCCCYHHLCVVLLLFTFCFMPFYDWMSEFFISNLKSIFLCHKTVTQLFILIINCIIHYALIKMLKAVPFIINIWSQDSFDLIQLNKFQFRNFSLRFSIWNYSFALLLVVHKNNKKFHYKKSKKLLFQLNWITSS